MSLRSKLGLSLAGIALVATAACGPKPAIRIDTEPIPTTSSPLKEQILYDGQISRGKVTLTRTNFSDMPSNMYYLTFNPSNSDTCYNFNDENASGELGDGQSEWAWLYKFLHKEIDGSTVSKPIGEYGVNYTIKFNPKFLRLTKGEGFLADKAVEQSERLVKGEFNTLYQSLLKEVADSLGVDLLK